MRVFQQPSDYYPFIESITSGKAAAMKCSISLRPPDCYLPHSFTCIGNKTRVYTK